MTDQDKDKYLTIEDRLIWSAYVEQEQIESNFKDDLDDFETLLIETLPDDDIVTKSQSMKRSHTPSNKTRIAPQSNEIDRRTDEKLRKGKMPIEARCDLHGLNQVQAYDLLNQFITTALGRGCRCVLIITGKGKSRIATSSVIEPERGVLKQKLSEWLTERQLAPHILKTYPAQGKDGGTGAMYVYLRRAR